MGDSTVAHGALLLSDPHFAEEHAPEIVVCVGVVPGLSRLSVLTGMIREAPMVIVADERAAAYRPDPTRNASMFVSVVPEPPTAFELYDDSWLDAWLAADARATAITKRLDEGSTLTGPDVARTLGRASTPRPCCWRRPPQPVGAFESFARVREADEAPLVIGNRRKHPASTACSRRRGARRWRTRRRGRRSTSTRTASRRW